MAMAVSVCGCSSKDEAKSAPAQPESAPAQPAPDEKPAVDEKPTVHLPANGFKVTEVFGKMSDQLDKVLGKSEKYDPGRIYDGFPHTAVTVEFENGKAVLVRVTAAEYSHTAANRKAVLAWAGADGADWSVDPGGGTLEIWAPGAQERYRTRMRVGEEFGDFLKRAGMVSGHARGEVGTVLLVRGKPCDGAVLTRIRRDATRELAADFGALGFLAIQCGLDGPVLKLK
ncbi:MAG TPA: hypothetical protein VN253_24870 [Kofleriaceae bacterium]|nr:hypothetical protein [Kofleriaceae bacterium]